MNPVTVSERANAGVIEEYYQRWLDNPDSVDPTWRAFFQGFTLGSNGQAPTGAPAGVPRWAETAGRSLRRSPEATAAGSSHRR